MNESERAEREFFLSLAEYDRSFEESPLLEPVLPPDTDLEGELTEALRRIAA